MFCCQYANNNRPKPFIYMNRLLHITLLTALSATPAALAQPGALDPAFGSGGIQIGQSTPERAYGVAVDGEGRVILAGERFSNSRLGFIVRLLPDGSYDTSFAADGLYIFDTPDDDAFSAIAVDEASRVYATGQSGLDLIVVRLTADGTPDITFGIGGVFRSNSGSSAHQDEGHGLSLTADGGVLVAGTADYYYGGGTAPPEGQFHLLRLTAEGDADTSFGADGYATYSDGIVANDVTEMQDGRVIAAGYQWTGGTDGPCVVRAAGLLPDGTLDTSFGVNGWVLGPTGAAHAVRPTPDGGFVLGGTSGGAMFVMKCHADGQRDTTFGTDGLASTAMGLPDGAFGNALVVEPSGNVVAAGRTSGNMNYAWALVRFRPDGTLDSAFGTGGIATVYPGGKSGQIFALTLQADGALMAAGDQGEELYWATARFGGTTTSEEPSAPAVPFVLAAYPSPAARGEQVAVALAGLPHSTWTRVTVYDLLGRTVARLYDAPLTDGNQRLTWDTRPFASGLYFIRAEVDGAAVSRRVIVMER